MSESIVIALIGVSGAVIGSIATVAVQVLNHCLQQCAAAKKEKPRKDLLLQLLQAPQFQWRKLETLMHVIGADEETTKRLLLEVGARGSEDGQAIWGLVKRNPLPSARRVIPNQSVKGTPNCCAVWFPPLRSGACYVQPSVAEMVFLAITAAGLKDALHASEGGAIVVWCGADAISESAYAALGHANLSRLIYPLQGQTGDVLARTIETIEEHHPDASVWVERCA
jgi:hypothetical protein